MPTVQQLENFEQFFSIVPDTNIAYPVSFAMDTRHNLGCNLLLFQYYILDSKVTSAFQDDFAFATLYNLPDRIYPLPAIANHSQFTVKYSIEDEYFLTISDRDGK